METLSLAFTALAALVLPLSALFYFSVRLKRCVKPYLLGAATFLVFQLFSRIPLIEVLSLSSAWFAALPMRSPLAYALLLGLSAALFEELGRYIVMKLFLKKERSLLDAAAFGIGHGGVEAIVFTGLSAFLMLIGAVAPAIDSLSIFLGGIERLCAMSFHIVWSVLVMLSVKTGDKKPLFIAIGLHTLLDAGVTMLSITGVSLVITEAILIAAAIMMLMYFKTLRTKFTD